MSTLFGGQQLTQPSLFNTSFNSASIQQQQQQQNQQQQQQQQPQQPQQQQAQQIQQQQPQLFNTQQYYQQQQQPLWLQNQKKRTIPNHLVPKKKQSFQLGTTNNNNHNNKLNSKNKNKTGKNRSNNGDLNGGDLIISNDDNDNGQFNLLSFGSNLNRRVTSGSGSGISGSLLDRNTSIASLFDNSIGDLSRIDDSFIGGDNTIDDINDDGNGNNNGDGFGNDLPPKNSMYDLSNINGSGKGTRDKNGINSDSKFESFINKDPKTFDSVFNKFQEFTPILDPNNVNVNANGFGGTSGVDEKPNTTNNNDILQNQKHYNLAIIVFGYPENLSIEIIKFFQSFGRILEKFDTTSTIGSSGSTNNNNNIKEILINLAANSNNNNNNNNNTITNKIVPIFSGKHWIKLTFDNPNSALQALQENGNVFNGSIIGVVPYHKSIIEKLENRKIFINDNDSTIMGEGNLDIPLDKVNQIINQQSKLVSTPGGTLNKNNNNNNSNNNIIGETIPTSSTTTTTTTTTGGGSLYNRLDIKPISKDQIFLKDNLNSSSTTTTNTNGGDSQNGGNNDGNKTINNNNKEKLGVWGNLSKYIFGFHDL